MAAPNREDLHVLQATRKAVLFFVVFAVCGLSAISQTHTGPHELLEGFGLALVALCIGGRAWCTLYIGGKKTAQIVQRGPYSVTRNPLYLFSFLGSFGVGAQTGSVTLATLFLFLTILVFYITVLREEAWLKARFGSSYDAYLSRTPRFWPNMRLWHDADLLEVRPSLFLKTLRDGAAFLLATPLFEMLEYAQHVGWIRTLFSLP